MNKNPFLIGDSMTGGYGKGADILHNCTVAVNKGEIAVIVGPNGAGKSTAMKAIFGMLDMHTGSVLIDGEDITNLSPQDRVAKGMAFVPQNQNIFTSLSVEENLEMGAFLRTDDISETMTQVFDLFPILKEKRKQAAGELSGGQRQRLSIARAIAKDSAILILDEATSALDSATEKLVHSAITKMQKGRTTIIIAHRLSTIQNADRIIVLKEGEIIEQGSHKELIKASGEYAKLNQQQL